MYLKEFKNISGKTEISYEKLNLDENFPFFHVKFTVSYALGKLNRIRHPPSFNLTQFRAIH